jgi:predicted RNase H-like nuclease (RuvC/YqgF family)
MADIVTDLRDRAYSGKVPDSLSERAADEIDRLRSRVRFCDGVIRSGDVAAITEAEREALERGICSLTGVEDLSESVDPMDDACTIRNLLDRLGGERPQSADIALRNNLRLCRGSVEGLQAEVARLKKIIEDYAKICAATSREINGLLAINESLRREVREQRKEIAELRNASRGDRPWVNENAEGGWLP